MLFTCPYGPDHSHNTYGKLGMGGGVGVTEKKRQENAKVNELTLSVEAGEENNCSTRQIRCKLVVSRHAVSQ
jgi:hypothetical protein